MNAVVHICCWKWSSCVESVVYCYASQSDSTRRVHFGAVVQELYSKRNLRRNKKKPVSQENKVFLRFISTQTRGQICKLNVWSACFNISDSFTGWKSTVPHWERRHIPKSEKSSIKHHTQAQKVLSCIVHKEEEKNQRRSDWKRNIQLGHLLFCYNILL